MKKDQKSKVSIEWKEKTEEEKEQFLNDVDAMLGINMPIADESIDMLTDWVLEQFQELDEQKDDEIIVKWAEGHDPNEHQ